MIKFSGPPPSHSAKEEAILSVLEAKQEVEDGKVLRGDLRKLLNATD